MVPAQDRRTRARTAALTVLSVALLGFGTVALSGCGSSGTTEATQPASIAPTPTTSPTDTADAPAASTSTSTVTTTTPAPTSTAAPATTAAQPTTVLLTDADVADLEKQLDEIDQLLAGVDADLSQD